MLRAEILAIGDELTHGQIQDTNSRYIANLLERHGVDVARFATVSDAPDEMHDVLRESCARADLVVATGGLGPTEDDRTRDVVARVAGEPLVVDEPAWQAIERRFAAIGRTLSPSNRRQAERPESARTLGNEWGTAPGFAMHVGRAELFVFPGVPRELYPMLERHLEPYLMTCEGARPMAFARLQVIGPPESVLGERIAEFMQHGRNPRVGITASMGVLSVRIAASGDTSDQARDLCEATAAEIRPIVREDLVCEGLEDIPHHVVERMSALGLTLATGESCTGGLVAQMVTAVPGASRMFAGGFVTYQAARKVADLGVPESLIAAHGEVSPEVAAAMATGARERAGASIGIGISGIAGPDGGTPDKPVGFVCFGIDDGRRVTSWSRRLPPLDRGFVRHRAAVEALAAVLRRLDER
ncbi:MAG: competence/damage-inducible protein A [Planctomycetes bacterium]|nr:competence/damage-inducible protein A [Planctomycetota bacterium]